MADELGYYELSCMGNPYIKTPRIDRLAKEGMRFTQALAAAPVCGPLRACLMTGRHMGHTSMRKNDGGTPIRADEATIADMLKQRGYATGGFGKWGAGGRGSTGVPENHGFDIFFGYYDQVHAHSYYPPYLIQNSKEIPLEGNVGGRSGKTYSHHPIMKAALEFIRENKDKPFFCYLPVTPPHGLFDIPADEPAWRHYKDSDWINDPSIHQDVKNYAAMVSMVDDNLGQILDLLKELSLDKNTIVFFTGDNGGYDYFKNDQHPRGFFRPNVNPETGVPFRGHKRLLYEGGLRIPFIVNWPGVIQADTVSDHLCSQTDVMTTLADLSGAKAPDNDGISFAPTLLNKGRQKQHTYLYWEYDDYKHKGQQAVRMQNWKAVKPGINADWELYDLDADISETTNLASRDADRLKTLISYADKAHSPAIPGTFSDRSLHEKDRQAKWGTTKMQK
jgi:arylsulfatase A-like enzyme